MPSIASLLGIGEGFVEQGFTGEFWTVQTACLAMVVYAFGLWYQIGLRQADRAAATTIGKWARSCWTVGWATFLVHVAVAFDVYHDWSHADAFDRTRQVSGYGEGIYVSYLFTIVWTVDVAWWWLRPSSYATRSAWIQTGVHSFMAFIAINGSIIFAEGPIRWFGILATIALIGRIILFGNKTS